MRRPSGFTLIDMLITMATLAVLTSLVVPRYNGTAEVANEAVVHQQLQTIRQQIEYYNAQHPEDAFTPFHADDPGRWWKQLIETDLIPNAPANPLQNGSRSVMLSAGLGTGWVWTDPELDGHYTIYAVDNQGNLLDADGDGVAD